MPHDAEPPRSSVLRRVLHRILALDRAEPSPSPGAAEGRDDAGAPDEDASSLSRESRLAGLGQAGQDTLPGGAAARRAVPERFGRYVILYELGQGGLSVVHAAYDPELDRKVAIKIVRARGFAPGGEAHQRLLREAQAIARLSHPNVIQVFDAGESEGQVFVTMELIRGQTLRAWLRHEQLDYWARSPTDRDAAGSPRLTRRTKTIELPKARPWQEVLTVFIAAGRGLAAAHAAGVIHRDFKPDNVMIDREHRVRVLDFGLARSIHHHEAVPPPSASGPEPDASVALGHSLTRTGTIMGTPAYMSPEQLGGQPADARTDQFSYCVALYESVYGERPFAGQSLQGLMVSIGEGPRTPPGGAAAPAALWPMLRRGLAAASLDRYPAMDDLLVDLQSLVESRPPRWARWQRWVRWGAAASVAAGLLGWVLLHEGASESLCNAEPMAVHDASSTAAAALDARWTAWRAAQRSACEAPALDPGVARCLERQRVELDALAGATGDATARVAEVLARLPPPEVCGALVGQAVVDPPPVDEAAVRARIGLALRATAQGRDLAAVQSMLAELEHTGNDVELAELQLVIAGLDGAGLDGAGLDGPLRSSREDALYRAVERAEAAARPDIAARAWLELVEHRATSDPAAARELLRVALPALARARHPAWLMARWHAADARLAAAAGGPGLERATEALKAQLAALQAVALRDPRDERAVIERLVGLLREQGRTGEAEQWSERLASPSAEPLP